MPTPATRTPIRIARGTYANLNSSIADILEGELVYATDQNKFYVKEGASLIATYLTTDDIGVSVQGYDINTVKTTANQTLTNKSLTSPTFTGLVSVNGSYRGNVIQVPNLDINCSSGNYFTKLVDQSVTFTFSNIPSSASYSFTLCVVHDAGSITWPASVKWPQNTAPLLTSYRNHKFMFTTYNGGTVWYGAALPNYSY